MLTGRNGTDTPQISVTHEGKEVAEVTLEAEGTEGHWHLSFALPPEAIATFDDIHRASLFDLL